MPVATYAGVPADTIQKTYEDKDLLVSIIWMHVCSHACYFSTTDVDAPLNHCYGKTNVERDSAAIPREGTFTAWTMSGTANPDPGVAC